MTGFVRGALAVTAGLALLATSAMAGVPSPANSQVDPVMVGNITGTPLKAGGFGTAVGGLGFKVVVEDIGGAPIVGATVTVDFTTAAGDNGTRGAVDVVVWEEQVGGATCSGDVISKTTDGTGTVFFTPIFSGCENTPSIEVRANGVLLDLIRARSTDLDGNEVTGTSDLAILQTNLFAAANVSGAIMEADFTVSEALPGPKPVTTADLAILQTDIFDTDIVVSPCI